MMMFSSSFTPPKTEYMMFPPVWEFSGYLNDDLIFTNTNDEKYQCNFGKTIDPKQLVGRQIVIGGVGKISNPLNIDWFRFGNFTITFRKH